MCPQILIQGYLSCFALLSEFHKGLIQGDANQPGRELGITPEIGQVLVSPQEAFLNRVLGIFPVMRDALSDSKKFAIVPLYELLESGNISILASLDKIEVILCLFPYSELC